jgi:radical SAM protein with 4Fe4S-binding SPASM domain
MTYRPLAPDYIQFYPTTRCNRSCDFCFNRSLPGTEDMPFAAFRRMIDMAASAGVRFLDIIGGEPTLHQDLPLMVERALSRGLGVNISSNGSDPAMLAEIMRRFPRVVVGLSVNDLQTLQDLERFIRKHRPVVKTVLSRDTGHDLIDRVLALGLRRYYLIYRDALRPDELDATLPFDRFLEIAGSRDGSKTGMVFCSGFPPDVEQYPILRTARCPAGTTKLGILPDGSVYPCNLFFGFPQFRLGNILETAFEDIWCHSALAYFRTYAGNACPRRDCVLHARCHGGCPAHSFAHAGKLSAPDPRCVRSR